MGSFVICTVDHVLLARTVQRRDYRGRKDGKFLRNVRWKAESKSPLERSMSVIEIDASETVDWIYLAKKWVQLRTSVNTVKNIQAQIP
jgi:hypothetical protein